MNYSHGLHNVKGVRMVLWYGLQSVKYSNVRIVIWYGLHYVKYTDVRIVLGYRLQSVKYSDVRIVLSQTDGPCISNLCTQTKNCFQSLPSPEVELIQSQPVIANKRGQ